MKCFVTACAATVMVAVVAAAILVDATRLRNTDLLHSLTARGKDAASNNSNNMAAAAAAASGSAKFLSGLPPFHAADPVTCPKVASSKVLDAPPRKMWGWIDGVSGFCGETCFQAALAMNGAWFSAEWVRYADGDAELLVGVNDEKAAKALNMKYSVWDGNRADANDFLADFVKPQIDAGAPVVLGFYELQKRGDSEYDHIMLITGYDADSTGKIVGLVYNDWWSQAQSRHLCRYSDAAGTTTNPRFIATRSGCQMASDPTKQPYDYCIPKTTQYAIALSGLTVNGDATTYLRATKTWEPDWSAEDNLHQKPEQQDFTLQISGLTNGKTYSVLRFDGPEAFSRAAGNLGGGSWTWSSGPFTAAGATKTMTVQLMSDARAYYVTVLGSFL